MGETVESMRAALIECCATMLWGKGIRKHLRHIGRSGPTMKECHERARKGVAEFEAAVVARALADPARRQEKGEAGA